MIAVEDVAELRALFFFRRSLEAIGYQTGWTRPVLVEAFWALKRHPGDPAACVHLNTVLGLQRQGVPLVNGRPR